MKGVRKRGAARCGLGAAVLATVALLSACGGGGGGGGGGGVALPLASTPAPAPVAPSGDPIVASWTVAGQCAAPRVGIDPDTGAAFPDQPGSLATEKSWLRAWIDETYLWYLEVPGTLVATEYVSPIAYFNVLKTPLLTPAGRPKDRFHFTAATDEYRALAQSGVEIGYGLELAFVSASPPRDIRVAFTEPDSPAAQAAIDRGLKLIEIDGIDVVAGADVAGLNAALAPKRAGETHSFKLQAADGSVRSASLSAAAFARTSVQNVKTIDTAGGRVGYMLFNDHTATAEAQLIAAINQFKAAAITDLVIDMRYNGGGYLDIASELAYMVATPAATRGMAFEVLHFNSKNPFGIAAAQGTVPFHATSRGFSTSAGQQLPQLGLSRVTVLTGPDTCSASESVVNGLRGVGVAVDLVGGGTCGKPYGFYPQDNCGTTYFAIQFQGVNQQGFGDYGDGFAPTCPVADDFGHALGDVAEGRLAAALAFRSTGACPAASAAKAASALAKAEAARVPYLIRSPLRENRIMSLP